MGFLLIALLLFACSVAFPLANVITPKRWLDITGFVFWTITAVYLLGISIFLGITTPHSDRYTIDKYNETVAQYAILDSLTETEYAKVSEDVCDLNNIIIENREYIEKYQSRFWFGLFKHEEIAELEIIN